ncbi:hypothetical protein GYMLUDRAFT_45603 [Collybiopsis luxurians FD-317 M1]|uniref:Uncharacterized protein n=1 Tax=Collybiopsis luxurians FD-317 M1 TaxID=944289 RepID=A0A0D0CR88_9AGAR|nr:hypothetical protein GYMLUDRAFT_75113 [Collybiopsis luxurians FD-317 M1]KIK58052.1 hypothetical protein GYMLUDRAFT_45603 [Collybiopsis luxurians FD-317 M1]
MHSYISGLPKASSEPSDRRVASLDSNHRVSSFQSIVLRLTDLFNSRSEFCPNPDPLP